MTSSRRNKGGLAELLRLVAKTGLPRGELMVLTTLMRYCDWDTGENLWPSIATIARESGYKPRQTINLLNNLEVRGLVETEGYCRGGRGKTQRRRVNLRRLRELAEGSGDSEGSEAAARKPCIPRQQTVHSVRPNYAATAHNQLRNQSKNQPPPRDAERRTQHAPPEGHPRARTTPAEAVEAESLLVEKGISKTKAQELAAVHPPAVIRAGISLWKRAVRGDAGPGLLVMLLEDGSATCEYEQREAERARQSERELLDRRSRQVRGWEAALARYRTTPDGPQVLASLKVVRRVWPTDEAIAASGVLTDAELRDAHAHPLIVLRQLEQAAEQRRTRADRAPTAVLRKGALVSKGGVS